MALLGSRTPDRPSMLERIVPDAEKFGLPDLTKALVINPRGLLLAVNKASASIEGQRVDPYDQDQAHALAVMKLVAGLAYRTVTHNQGNPHPLMGAAYALEMERDQRCEDLCTQMLRHLARENARQGRFDDAVRHFKEVVDRTAAHGRDAHDPKGIIDNIELGLLELCLPESQGRSEQELFSSRLNQIQNDLREVLAGPQHVRHLFAADLRWLVESYCTLPIALPVVLERLNESADELERSPVKLSAAQQVDNFRVSAAVFERVGEYQKAGQAIERAVEVARTANDKMTVLELLSEAAHVYRFGDAADFKRALVCSREALFEATEYLGTEAAALYQVEHVHLLLDGWHEEEARAELAKITPAITQTMSDVVCVRFNLARGRLNDISNPALASKLLRVASSMAHGLGLPSGPAHGLRLIGPVYREELIAKTFLFTVLGSHDETAPLFGLSGQIDEYLERTGDAEVARLAMRYDAAVLRSRRANQEPEIPVTRAHRIVSQFPVLLRSLEFAELLLEIGLAHFQAGDEQAACTALLRARTNAEYLGDPGRMVVAAVHFLLERLVNPSQPNGTELNPFLDRHFRISEALDC